MTPSDPPPPTTDKPASYKEALLLAVARVPHLAAFLIIAYGVYQIIMTALPYCFGNRYTLPGG